MKNSKIRIDRFWNILKNVLIISVFIIPILPYIMIFFNIDIPDINIPTFKRKPITEDTAYTYLDELRYYIKESGDTDICLYFIEYMEENSIEEFDERLRESYEYGYSDAYRESENRENIIRGESYEEGWFDGYKQGYSDSSENLPYDNDVSREFDDMLNGY